MHSNCKSSVPFVYCTWQCNLWYKYPRIDFIRAENLAFNYTFLKDKMFKVKHKKNIFSVLRSIFYTLIVHFLKLLTEDILLIISYQLIIHHKLIFYINTVLLVFDIKKIEVIVPVKMKKWTNCEKCCNRSMKFWNKSTN